METLAIIKRPLSNLQIMEGSENESKNKTPFKKWIHGVRYYNTNTNDDEECITNVPDIQKFLSDNYIPTDVSLELEDFEVFFEKRKSILKEEIKKRVFLSNNDI